MKQLSESIVTFNNFLIALPVFSAVVVGNASLVRGSVPCQREERRHHVGAFRHRDPEGDWNQ